MKNLLDNIACVIATLILLCLILTLPCCKVQYVEKEVTKTVEVHHRDTAIVTESDSASLHALIKCDSANHAYIDYMSVQNGRINELTAQLSNGRLDVSSVVTSDTVTITLHDTVTTIVNNTNTREEVEKKGFLWYSGIMLWVLIGLLVAGVILGIVIKFAK